MRRWFFLSTAAIAVVLLGFAVLLIMEIGTLAKRTVHVGNSTVVFRIEEKDGSLSASASEWRRWSNEQGWYQSVWIGESNHVGVSDPDITLDNERGLVILRVGKAVVEFDLQTNELGVPTIAP